MGFHLESACDNISQLYTTVYSEIFEEEILTTSLC